MFGSTYPPRGVARRPPLTNAAKGVTHFFSLISPWGVGRLRLSQYLDALEAARERLPFATDGRMDGERGNEAAHGELIEAERADFGA